MELFVYPKAMKRRIFARFISKTVEAVVNIEEAQFCIESFTSFYGYGWVFSLMEKVGRREIFVYMEFCRKGLDRKSVV